MCLQIHIYKPNERWQLQYLSQLQGEASLNKQDRKMFHLHWLHYKHSAVPGWSESCDVTDSALISNPLTDMLSVWKEDSKWTLETLLRCLWPSLYFSFSICREMTVRTLNRMWLYLDNNVGFQNSICFFPTGASDNKSVLQTPPFVTRSTGESLVAGIKCSHSIPNNDRILWYKQGQQQAFTPLGYVNVNHAFPENNVRGKISFDGNGRERSSLTISDLLLNDTGVYFCAASLHSAADSPLVNEKSQPHKQDVQTSWAPATSLQLNTSFSDCFTHIFIPQWWRHTSHHTDSDSGLWSFQSEQRWTTSHVL